MSDSETTDDHGTGEPDAAGRSQAEDVVEELKDHEDELEADDSSGSDAPDEATGEPAPPSDSTE